ncbi:hypothetical protein EHV15_05220 [Paenibacillus oralis]|uniref:Calcineurin-like phosphoesterase domain-containing protein n=1 Tax=Paenibacillus oralis TaxID=2490856 RepID=A0A3P3TXI0_9BACL|nr:hypothetical protein [Paenibacillus oralis]RRJ62416.1 hypothetical protein EHV15_05220 [Paenibacillus oralis]
MPKHIWTPEEDKRLDELKGTGTYAEIAAKLTNEFSVVITSEAVRKRIKRGRIAEQAPAGYKETVEILADGSHRSDKLLRMSAEQSKDVNFLLKAHGYDLDVWELVSARNNIWNVYSKQDGVQTLYSSKITVKPKVSAVNWDDIIKKIETIKPVYIERRPKESAKYLNVPLFDMHFGISNYETYKETQRDIALLLEQGYKEVLFIIGQDLLHNDDMRGRTSSGREIEKVNMERAWEDATLFYIPLIELALDKCQKVKVVYSKGNHDESMGWAFVKCLEARYPQVGFDTRFKERKAHMLGHNFIGINHGDKKKIEKLPENFSTEFPLEWSRAKTRELFTGHEHHEKVIDKGGVVIRRMPTGNEIDTWHDDYGYTTAHKRFEVFEYTEDKVLRIHYV